MDSGDDRSSTAGVGPDWALIPGSASALFDMDGWQSLTQKLADKPIDLAA